MLSRSLGVAVVVLVVLTASPAAGELEDNVFSSERWRVEMEAPSNWQPTEQAAYPNILLWMERRDPKGVMLLAAERVPPKATSSDYAKLAVAKLEELGFRTRSPQLHTTTGASLVDFENDKAFLRQAYLVVDGIGYTLTLSAESSRLRGLHLRAFDGALRSIKRIKRAKPAAENEPKGE